MANSNSGSFKLDNSSESDFLNDWAVFTNGDIKESVFTKSKEDESFLRSDSSSSSDVDVIDDDNLEKLEDIRLANQTSALPAPHITFSTLEDILSEQVPYPSDNVEDITTDHSEYDDELEIYGVDDSCLASIGKVIVAFVLASLLCNIGWGYLGNFSCKDHKGMIKDMKQIIKDLNFENSNLKNQLTSENHKEASFGIQIKELENKNVKLNEKLQNALSEVQSQSFSHYSESKILHREINQLKEQLNIMQYDNEELQKQLGQLRYRSFTPPPPHIDHKSGSENYDSTSNVNFTNSGHDADFEKKNDNSTEILAEDLKKLHLELILEMEKVKKWNEVLELLSEKLQNFDSKDKKWTLQDIKQNFNDIVLEAQKNVAETVASFQNLNISDMFTKYMKYNEKTVENVFDSIGQYFKAAQEKTQTLFKRNVPNINKEATINNVWSAAEKLKEKWSYMKDEFFKMTDILEKDVMGKPAKKPTGPENKKTSVQDDNNIQKPQMSHHKHSAYSDKNSKNIYDKHVVENHSRNTDFKAEEHNSHYHDKDDSITWIFRRAADRAKLRQNVN